MTGRRHAGRIALVLAGGAARGAYEVGVVQYIVHEVARALGREVPLDILCGTSVGAINACALAAHAHEPRRRVDRLVDAWTALRIHEVARPSAPEVGALFAAMLGQRRRPPAPGDTRRGGLLDPRGVEAIVRRAIPAGSIRGQIRAGRVDAVTVSTTNVATGKTVVFVQSVAPRGIERCRDATVLLCSADLTAEHALASAAVPPLFPAVRLEGDFFCDGGLRQNVPLSPARKLGADGLIVVNPRHVRLGPAAPAEAARNETHYPGPAFLVGKAMNALLLDRIDADLDRLSRINAILEAGRRRFGVDFVDELNAALSALEHGSPGLRPLSTVHIRASHDIGSIAAEYARSPEFARRGRSVAWWLLRRFGQGEGGADFLSYVLFDGGYAARLIELGRRDAGVRHEELCEFVERIAPAGAKKNVQKDSNELPLSGLPRRAPPE